MATVDIEPLTRLLTVFQPATHTGFTLDATGDWLGLGFVADRTASADRVVVRRGGGSGTTPNFRVGIEGATITGGVPMPDGTYLGGGSAYGDLTAPASNTAHEVTLGASASLTLGDLYYVTIRHLSGTIDGSNTAVWQFYLNGAPWSRPLCSYNTTGSNASTNLLPCVSVRYGSTSAWNVLTAAVIGATNSWSSSSSPRWRGNKFTPASSFRSTRIWCGIRPATASDFDIEVYKNSGTTPEFEISVDADKWTSSGNFGGWFPHAEYAYTAGDTYRIVVNPTTTTAITSLLDFTALSSGEIEAWAGPYHKTTCSTLGTWTDTTTAVFPIAAIPTGADYTASGGLVGFAHA